MSNLPIYVAITPEDLFLVIPFMFYVSSNPGPRKYAAAQVQHASPFVMQLWALEGVIVCWTTISQVINAALPHFPMPCCWCSNYDIKLVAISKKCVCAGVPEAVGIIEELY